MKKRVISLLLLAAMVLTLLAACDGGTEGESPSPSGSGTLEVEDGYIPAPYTADASQAPTEYVAPVFYQNEDGPTISVVYTGVIVEDGKYFRDSDNDQELDPFEDWRLSTDERMDDLLGKLTMEQRAGLLGNFQQCYPSVTSAEDVYDENGNVIFEQLIGAREDFPVEYILDTYIRSGVIRSDTDVETGALYNNALQMLAEYSNVTKGEVIVPFMLKSNPMNSGYPNSMGFTAAVQGDGNADAVKSWAEVDAQIWDAKGIHHMYGPQIDLVTDPRWPRNNTTYGEDPEVLSQIAVALVEGYQSGTDGAQTGDVALIMKHFPGDGAAYNGFESHDNIGQFRIYSTEGSLEKYHLVGFQAAIDAGVAGIMPGYSRNTGDARCVPQTVNGVTIEPDGLPNAYSETMLQTLLRDVMGFEGFINSDSGVVSQRYFNMADMTEVERFAACINAGIDILGDAATIKEDYCTQVLESGLITDEAFDRATTTNMKSYIDLGMFENPYRDPATGRALEEELASTREASKTEFNQKSVVLMKNSDGLLPLDTGKSVYVRLFNGTGVDTEDTVADELAAMGYTIVEDYNEADVAILMVVPAALATRNMNHIQVINLVEDIEIPEYDSTSTGEKTGNTIDWTTVADVDEIAEIADAVHANGGKVIGTINITSPWILTNLEPYCDALLGTFDTSDQAVADVISGAYSPTGKLPVTMVSCEEVIAVNEEVLSDGNTYEVCVSPNDVPGYDKEQYMDPEVLAQSPSGSYAYQDTDCNFYWSGFGLSY